MLTDRWVINVMWNNVIQYAATEQHLTALTIVFLASERATQQQPPPIPSSTSDHSGLAWITAPISPKWLFGTIQLFLTSASEGAHMLIDSDFNNEFKRQEMFVGQLAVLWHSTVEQSFIHFFLVKIAASQGYCWLRGLEWTQPGP